MTFIVWHATDEAMRHGLVSKPEFPKDYRRVALVKCNDLEDVFRATNHIDHDWTTNSEVVFKVGNQHRSTSVGDVVEEFKPDGKKFLCAMAGWTEVAA